MDIQEYYLGGIQAADLPPPKPVKAPAGKLKTTPPYLGGAKGTAVPNSAQNITNLVMTDYVRNERTIGQVIKKLVLSSPDLSNAVETKIKSAMSSSYTVIAMDPTGRVDPAATELVQSLVQRMDLSAYDYTRFTRTTDFRSLTSTLLYDSFRYGGSCLEVVLGESRLPAYFKAVPVRLLEWTNNVPEAYPIYKGEKDVPLNFPTIIYTASIQDGETPYAESPLQSAVQACLFDMSFQDDLRRAATKNLLQRLSITINTESYLKTLPLAVAEDSDSLKTHMDNTVAALESQLANLDPEDSLVYFDILSADTLADANRSEDRSIKVLQELISGKVVAGAKVLPSIVGRGQSSTAASTESLLFLKAIATAQLELNVLISRALTLSVRLFGLDAYVKFELEEVNLRPSLELESFRAIKQSSILEQLSLGLITDQKASIDLTGALPPDGYKELSGTMFATKKADVSGNDYSNTSVSADGKTDSTQSQKSSGDTTQKGVKSS